MAGRKLPFILGISPLFNFHDLIEKSTETSRSYYSERDPNETGWDRLYNMYSVDEFGTTSPEMNFAIQGTFMGTFIGVVWGGMVKSRQAHDTFIDRNQATSFPSIYDAKKKLQETVILNFARGGFKFGWRLGLFTGSYVIITTSISTYRGKSSMLEYIAAGGITGMAYKLSLGPRGMMVGGALGTLLGGFAGIASLTLLKLTGTTMEEIRYWQYNWKLDRDKHIRATMAKHSEPDPVILKAHDERLRLLEEQKKDAKT